jgi:diadenosine tetraphosphatase ApaH/serine/threonine PP2A family protein phosphatase
MLAHQSGFRIRASSRFLHYAVARAPAPVVVTRPRGSLERHLQDFGEVKGVTAGALGDLLAAAESVGDDEPVGWGLADRGQKFEFADSGGDFVFVVVESEGAGHAAASRGGRLEIDANAAQEGFFGGHLHDRLVMAVAVEQGFAGELRERGEARVVLEEFAEQERLFAQGLGALVVREEIEEFVAENGDAAGLESDDRDSGFDLGFELVEDIEQETLGAVEHAEVVERASAAEIGLGDEDVVSGGFEHLDGGAGGCRLEIVIEGVGP